MPIGLQLAGRSDAASLGVESFLASKMVAVLEPFDAGTVFPVHHHGTISYDG